MQKDEISAEISAEIKLIDRKVAKKRLTDGKSNLLFSNQAHALDGAIDLFSLYVLFSHFRPRDATRGNSFFQMSSYARANVRIINEKTKEKFP